MVRNFERNGTFFVYKSFPKILKISTFSYQLLGREMVVDFEFILSLGRARFREEWYILRSSYLEKKSNVTTLKSKNSSLHA